MFELGRTLIAACARSPNALAVVDDEVRFTYAQWLEQVGRLVAGLDALGLSRQRHVVMVLQNRWETAALHWACQLADLVVTPVNWRATAEELDYVLADSGAQVLVYEAVAYRAVADAPAAAGLERIRVGPPAGDEPDEATPFETLLAPQSLPLAPRAVPESTSVMLYTSGTTGRGKGVPRSHRAERAAALAHVAQNQYVFGESTLGVMPLYHTMGVRSLLAMACINGCFVCLPRFDAARALSLITAERITSLYLVPTLYHDLLHASGFADADVSSVRKLGFAGAPMTDGLLKAVELAFAPELFVNHYGSSEIYTFTIDQRAARKPGSAGRAGLNQEIRVIRLGEVGSGATVPPGVEGQIIARLDGDEAFEGYWQRSDADAKALHEGWYHTGDTGYFDEDGDLFVTGRVDDMIISGGENISPVEIESVLSLYPGVEEVAVVGLPDERWGQRVVAFVKRNGHPDSHALDAHCRSSALADFKRPREYVFVAEIPKSPVGKILRRMLIAGDFAPEP